MKIPQQLREVAERAKREKRPQRTTVRGMLSWYGYERRGSWIIELISRHLEELDVQAFPGFAGAYIDAPIYIVMRVEVEKRGGDQEQHQDLAPPAPHGPMHQISRLRAANTAPTSVIPNDTLAKAVTLMRMHDSSQLPVTVGDREVKGMISWKTIDTTLAAGQECAEVRDCMGLAREVRDTASKFDVIREVSVHDCVLVRGADKKIMGIVTASDISEQFQALAEPFLVLGDIESHLRHLIEQGRFDKATLNEARPEPRPCVIHQGARRSSQDPKRCHALRSGRHRRRATGDNAEVRAIPR